MKKLFFFFLFGFTLAQLNAQDYFLKNFSEPTDVSNQSAIATVNDGGAIHITQLASKELVIRRINKCGDQIWAKEIKHASLPLNLVGIQTDGNGNFVFAGNLGQSSSERQPFIASIKFDGTINFFKVINMPPNIESITYSLLVNESGDFVLYFNYDTGAGPNSISVAKLDAGGNLNWFNSYGGLGSYGQAIATKDGGVLFHSGSVFVKTLSDGSIEWANALSGIGHPEAILQVEGGYLLSRTPSYFVRTPSNLLKVSDQGNLQWVSNDLAGFDPRSGIIRKNGHAIFTGGAQGVGLIEVDTASGNLVRFKEYDPTNAAALLGVNLFEDSNGDILVSGVDNSGLVNSNFYLKVDSLLNLPSCSVTDLQLSNTNSSTISVSPYAVSTIQQSTSLLSITDEAFVETSIPNGTFIPQCIYQEDRGNHQLGADTTLCPGATLTLGDPTSSFDGYLWSTGANSKQITVDSEGEYHLEVITACDTLRDTINVSYFPTEPVYLGIDTILCEGDQITLANHLPLDNYTWSTGDNGATIDITLAGIYWLETQTSCGIYRDSIEVTTPAKASILELGEDTSLCQGESIVLGDPNTDFTQFQWLSGETSQFITVSQPGLYAVEATNGCDTLTDGIRVDNAPVLSPSFSASSLTLKTRETVSFQNTTLDAVSTEWNLDDGHVETRDMLQHQYELPGSYEVEMIAFSKEGCAFSTTQTIIVLPSDYSIPNVFSPDGDGINDLFFPIGNDIVTYEINLYDRWGKLFYSTDNIPWDGRNRNGRKLSRGVYYYHIQITFNYGKTIEEKGSIQLMR